MVEVGGSFGLTSANCTELKWLALLHRGFCIMRRIICLVMHLLRDAGGCFYTPGVYVRVHILFSHQVGDDDDLLSGAKAN